MFTKTNDLKILELFFINPNTKLHLREISRRTKLSVGGTKKILSKLEKLNLIIKFEKDVTIDYLANIENKEFKNLKLAYNIYTLKNSGLIEDIIKKYSPEVVVLFGSFSRAEDNENSDIDLALFPMKKISVDFEKYNKEFKRNISLIEFDPKSASKEFKNNLINGLVIYGYLRLFK